MNRNISSKTLSIWAGFILLIYSQIYIVNIIDFNLHNFFGYTPSIPSIVSSISFFISLQIISVMLFMRKNNLVLQIPLGIIAIGDIFWVIDAILNYPTIDNLIGCILPALSSTFLLIFSILTRKKAVPALRKLWFIPFLLEMQYLLMYIVMGFYLSGMNFVFIRNIYCIAIIYTSLAISTTTNKYFTIVKQATKQPANTALDNDEQDIGSIIFEAAQNEEKISDSNSNSIDEILRYKMLLDEGIITEEEFNKKKRQLLNL